MLVVSSITTDKITAGKLYPVVDFDTHDGWIINDLGLTVRIVFNALDEQLDFREKWFVLESSHKTLTHNSLIDLLGRVKSLENLAQSLAINLSYYK